MSSAVSVRELCECFGLTEKDPKVQALFAKLGKSTAKGDSSRKSYYFRDVGVQAYFSEVGAPKRELRTFFVYADKISKFKQFKGHIYDGFDFKSSREAVRSKLGTPFRSLPESSVHGPQDHFSLDYVILNFYYTRDEKRVEMIGVAPPEETATAPRAVAAPAVATPAVATPAKPAPVAKPAKPVVTELPERLKKLQEFCRKQNGFISGHFEAADGDEDVLMIDNPQASAQFIVFGRDSDGSDFAVWNHDQLDGREPPVVYIDSEGDGSSVIADNVDDFLRLLAIGADSLEDAPSGSLETADPPAPLLGEFRKWLKKTFKLTPADDPAAMAAKARANHPDLDEWIEANRG